MRESKASTPPQPLVHGVTNQNKSPTFALDEYMTRTAQVWADFEEYQRVLGDLKRRVELLEDILMEETPD